MENLKAADIPLSNLAARIKLARHELNDRVAGEVLKLFKWSVGATVAITVLLACGDFAGLLLHVIQPADRLISERVVLALIGASVVQVGAASAAIVYGLFGKNNVDEAGHIDVGNADEV